MKVCIITDKSDGVLQFNWSQNPTVQQGPCANGSDWRWFSGLAHCWKFIQTSVYNNRQSSVCNWTAGNMQVLPNLGI